MANSHVLNLLTAGSKSYVPLLRGCTGTEGGRGPRGGVGPRGPQGPVGPEGVRGPEVSSEYFSKRLIDQFNGFTPLYESVAGAAANTVNDIHRMAFQFDAATIESYLKTHAYGANSLLPFVWHRDEADPSQWTVEFKGANDQTLSTCSIHCPDQDVETTLCMRQVKFKDICAYELGKGSIFEFTPGLPHFVRSGISTPTSDDASPVDRTSFFGLRPGYFQAQSLSAKYSGQYFIHCRREIMDFEHYNDTELCIHGVDGTYPRIRFSKNSDYFRDTSGQDTGPASGFKTDITYNFTRVRSVSILSEESNTVSGFSSPIRSNFETSTFPMRKRYSSSDDHGAVQTRNPLAFRSSVNAEMADPPFDFDGVPSTTNPLAFYTWHRSYADDIWTTDTVGLSLVGYDPTRCGYFYCRTIDNSDPFAGGGASPKYRRTENQYGETAIVVPALREGFFLATQASSGGASVTVRGAELYTRESTDESSDVIMLVRFDAFRRPQRFIFLVFSSQYDLIEFVLATGKYVDSSGQTEVRAINIANLTTKTLTAPVVFTVADVEQRDTVNLSAGSTPVDSAARHPEAVATVDFVTQYVQGALA